MATSPSIRRYSQNHLPYAPGESYELGLSSGIHLTLRKMQKIRLVKPVQSDNLAANIVGKPVFWVLLVTILFGAPLMRGLMTARAPAPPPVLGSFPVFAVRDEYGTPFTADDLRGRAFIANLLCVHCTEDGQLSLQAMATLQHRGRDRKSVV